MYLCLNIVRLFCTALFYYSLGNVSPHYRSMLWNIQLLAVVRSTTLQKYGPDRILEPIMKDVKILEQVHYIAVSVL